MLTEDEINDMVLSECGALDCSKRELMELKIYELMQLISHGYIVANALTFSKSLNNMFTCKMFEEDNTLLAEELKGVAKSGVIVELKPGGSV